MQSFMINRDFKPAMDAINGKHKLNNNDDFGATEDDNDDNCKDKMEKMKTTDNAGLFSVERLLATDENRAEYGREIEQLREMTNLDHGDEVKQKQTEHLDADLNNLGFKMSSDEEFQSSKSKMLSSYKVNSESSTNDLNENVDVTDCDKLTTNSDRTITDEHNTLGSRSLKTDEKLKCDSEDSQEPRDNLGVLDARENLMRFAEVLYKCTLCTSIPSILTSKESFTKHITEQHLTHQQNFVDCPHCLLKFQTNEDLKEHKQLTHSTGSDITDNSDLQDYEGEADVITYDCDPLDRDDSDSHSSGHRSNTFVLAHAEAAVNKDGVTTGNGSLDLSLKSSQNSNRIFKNEKPSSERNPNRNLPLLHQITDQIVKSSTNNKGKFENLRPFGFTPSYTPEFGKYTKLVREGGNIVYFCQVCNWKSPVKATFSVHCGIADHKRKVIMAERSEKGSASEIDVSKLSKTLSNETNVIKTHDHDSKFRGISQSKEPVGWSPRGGASHLSLLSEAPGFYLGSKDGPVKRNDFYPYKRLEERGNSGQRKKKVVMNSVRHQMRLKPRWSDTDSDDDCDDQDDDVNRSPVPKSNETHKLVHAKEPECKTDFLSSQTTREMCPDIDVTTIKKEVEDKEVDRLHGNSKTHSVIQEDLGEPSEKKQKLSLHTETSVQNLIDKHVVENIKHNTETSMFKLYQCHLCVFEYSDLNEFGKHFEEVHKSDISPEKLDVDHSQRKLGDRSRTGTPNVELGENWRVQKLKDLLPDFVRLSARSNASRDLLLQRISLSAAIPELTGWSSACNKAMREMYPSSLAQRKGKFKKTFYFGVALSDDSKQDDEMNVGAFVGDPDTLSYQPIRDLNVDVEKLLEHLPTMLLWTGDMDKGVYRDDILLALSDMLSDPDIKSWGKQSNKAIRVVFPNVEIKRKGKDKTILWSGFLQLYTNTDQNLTLFQLFKQKISDRPKTIDFDNSGNSSPISKSHQASPDVEQPLNLAVSLNSALALEKSTKTKGNNSDAITPEINDKLSPSHGVEDTYQVEEYLAKFGGVSMFDSSNDDHEIATKAKPSDSDNVQCDISVTEEQRENS